MSGISGHDLDRASRLLAQHLAEAVARLGSGALDVVDLPPLTGDEIEPAQLRAVAALYWAMKVDEAGVLDFVDALAEGLRLGTLALDVGAAAPLVVDWHRRRAERLSADERHALYARLFGTDDVRQLLAALVSELASVYALMVADPHLLAQVSVTGEELASILSARSAGITAFAAREIVAAVREALLILQHHDVLAAFGQRSPGELLAAAGRALVGRPLDPSACFDQASAGQQILSWLADVGASLEGGHLALTPADAVVHAANTWQAITGSAPPTTPEVVIGPAPGGAPRPGGAEARP
jgi:hypothetical protein